MAGVSENGNGNAAVSNNPLDQYRIGRSQEMKRKTPI
jgi:hypothetical protein